MQPISQCEEVTLTGNTTSSNSKNETESESAMVIEEVCF